MPTPLKTLRYPLLSELEPIISASLNGDEKAIGLLITKLRPYIQNRIQYTAFYEPYREDLEAEVLMRLLLGLQAKRFNLTEDSNIYSWLKVLIKNVIVDKIRKNKTQPTKLVENFSFIRIETTSLETRIEDRFLIAAMLEDIKHRFKPQTLKIFSMYVEQGYTYLEIAEELEVSLSLVKNAIFRIRTYLKDSYR